MQSSLSHKPPCEETAKTQIARVLESLWMYRLFQSFSLVQTKNVMKNNWIRIDSSAYTAGLKYETQASCSQRYSELGSR